MPRYYFHLTDGNQVLNNHKGIDLSGDAAARDDLLESLKRLPRDHPLRPAVESELKVLLKKAEDK